VAWVVPKTNWISTDKENTTDFNRQKSNIAEVATVTLPSLYYFPANTAIADATRSTLPTQTLINTLEDNLLEIEDCGLTMPAGWGSSKVWTTLNPDYTDFNRWENNALLIYNMAESISERFAVSGTFVSGGHLLPRRV
jgi:hypothetical protein